MNLTIQQIADVKDGNPVKVMDSEIGVDCVVLRADLYERVKGLFENESDFSPREAYPATLKALDAQELSTDQYLEYLND